MARGRALISVYDKEGIEEFARSLAELGFEIISTGGTAALLRKARVDVRDVSEITGFPEVLDGRVKTLHPRIHAGILAKPTREHLDALNRLDVTPIDIVVVNLYPFERTVEGGAEMEEACENIDIGGPSMARAAAKNFERVTVVVNPRRYPEIISELREHGEVSRATRAALAAEAFLHTAAYDAAIANYFAEQTEKAEDEGKSLGDHWVIGGTKAQALRYGENPHQAAAFYKFSGGAPWGLAAAKQLGGKELSFNNLADATGAIGVVSEYDEPAVVIVKHANPCGVGVGKTPLEAYKAALDCDPVSAFGGIVAFNRSVGIEEAKLMSEIFLEVIIAPEFSPEAVELLHGKKNLRLLEIAEEDLKPRAGWDIRPVLGGFLVQNSDSAKAVPLDLSVVTKRAPNEEELAQLVNAWKTVAHVRSNAIVLWRGNGTVGVGAGQMNRVGAADIAIRQAGEKARGSVMASDGFFPFGDTVRLAAEAGVRAVIQPGGSLRDSESIEAADANDIAMVFTGVRHFKH